MIHEVRRLVPHITDGAADADTVTWTRAMMAAFLRPRMEPSDLARAAAEYEGQRLRGVYDDGDPAPVATLRSWDARMSVPGGEVAVDAVTSIGVRATLRRRGLLRAVLTDDLAEAARAGTPVAALTSTQGALYERFGFGLATWTRPITVTTAAVFRDAGPTGRLRTLDVGTLAAAAGPVHERARRRHPGSMDRDASRWPSVMTGAVGFTGMVADRHRHAVLWSDAAGRPGGYAVYRVAADWAAGSGSLAVLDLQATTPESYRELWRHLTSLDLVGSVSWSDASVDEPLPWLLADPRAVTTGGAREMLWLRVLDVPAALSTRRYPVTDRLRLRVHDTGGHADGTWELDTTDATAPAVTRLADGAGVDVEMPAPTLGAIYLGGPDPRVLARAGRLLESTPGAAGRLARLLAAPSVPWNGSRF